MPRAAHIGDYIALLALTAFWGTAFLFNELALASFSPSIIVAGRIMLAALILFVYMRAIGVRLPKPGQSWLPMLIMAVFANVLPFHLITWGQQHIDSSLAGVLMAVMPLFVVSLAHFYIPGSRMTPFRAAGFTIGFAGVLVVIGPDSLRGLGGNESLLGAVAVLGAALSYAASSIYARRIGRVDVVQLSVGMLVVASMVALPGAALDIPTIGTPTIGAMASIVILGTFATGVATLLYFRIVQGPGPTFLSFVNYLVPAWAVLAGALFLDEPLSVSIFAGLALILFGIAISELGPRLLRVLLGPRKIITNDV